MTSVVADFDAVDEINAAGPARRGRRAYAGLAVMKHGSVAGGDCDGSSIPRRAIEAAILVLESMIECTVARVLVKRGRSYYS